MVGQVIKWLSGNLMPLLIAGLLGFSAYQWVQAGRLEEQRDASAQRAARTEQDNQRLQSALDWQRSQAVALSLALSARDEALANIQDDIGTRLRALDQLEADDAQSRDWGGDRLPAGIADWVRGLGADAAGGGADAGSSAAPAIAAASTER